MQTIISGIQQMGIGVSDVREAWNWYIKYFGMDILIFDDTNVAEIMLPHTAGKPREKHAVLAINMHGGGGFEIWQHKGKTPEKPVFEIAAGDLGIYIAKLKCLDIPKAYDFFKSNNLNLLGEISKNPVGNDHFFIRDPFGNIFEIVKEDNYFKKESSVNGGVFGCNIGVSDIEKARLVYSDILGFDEVVYDKTGIFEDLYCLPGGKSQFRRMLLKQSKARRGGFSRLLGPGEIELIQVLDRKPQQIFKDRIWGDLGYIHLCFDIYGMDSLREECREKGFPFTVDSSSNFEMGDAAGHFSYIADPDGTLIEFVETHKVPVLKKIGWYLNMKNRNHEKALPNWMLRTLSFNRKKPV
jgi:catechol 2,3-dioxygenase-like lactoylglutathione lyase family enzyme